MAMRLRTYSVNADAAGKAASQRLEAEHDHLHDLLTSFIARIRERDESGITAMVDQIESFCKLHFDHEESVIRAQSEAAADHHRAAHGVLLRQLSEVRSALSSGPAVISAASRWYTAMTNHIDDVDRPGLARLLMDAPEHDLPRHGWHIGVAE